VYLEFRLRGAHGKCLLAAIFVIPRWKTNSAPSKPLVGFEGHFKEGKKRGKGNWGGESKGRKGTGETTENTPQYISGYGPALPVNVVVVVERTD